MKHPKSHRCSPSAQRRFVHLAMIAVMGLTSMGLIGCASQQPVYPMKEVKPGEMKASKTKQARHQVKVDGKTTICWGNFLEPEHDPQKNLRPGKTTPVEITVVWETAPGCTLGEGKVSVFLTKNNFFNDVRYCGSAPLLPSSSNNRQTLTFNCPPGTSTGIHYLKCYVTGTLSDGTKIPAKWHSEWIGSGHCP